MSCLQKRFVQDAMSEGATKTTTTPSVTSPAVSKPDLLSAAARQIENEPFNPPLGKPLAVGASLLNNGMSSAAAASASGLNSGYPGSASARLAEQQQLLSLPPPSPVQATPVFNRGSPSPMPSVGAIAGNLSPVQMHQVNELQRRCTMLEAHNSEYEEMLRCCCI